MFLAELDGTIVSLELAGDQESGEEGRPCKFVENVDKVMLMMGHKDEGRLQSQERASICPWRENCICCGPVVVNIGTVKREAWEWPPRVNNVEKYDG